MCRAHGVVGTFASDAWTSPVRTPQYYPDAVTLVPGDIPLLDRIDTSPGCGVKDSYATLSLPGFVTLFDAQWIARRPETASGPYAFDWSLVSSPVELDEFDRAFGGFDLFVPALLQSPQVAVFAGRERGQIVAGAVTNVSDSVVGLSNVFGPPDRLDAVWTDVVGAVAARYPDMPIVGYEQGSELAAAMECGFEPIGPLRVLFR
jgi:hypothetical protein